MRKIVIIGGVAGGATAAARVRRLDEEAQIIILERGEHISYANCGLPYYLGGVIDNRSEMLLATPESFKARFNIEVRVRREATAIDRAARTVTIRNLETGAEESESYDQLLLATGGRPIRPPIEGAGADGVFTLHSLAEADAIYDFIQSRKPRRAAILGGGFIGLEVAENLRRSYMEISLIELADQVMTPLDYEMACEIHHHLEQKGLKLYLNNSVQKISEAEGRLTLELTEGRLETDMLVLALGVRPENQLARAAGLDIGERGGLRVSPAMRTSDENIYAVGDAVEVTDPVTGRAVLRPLAGPAHKQARVAADNICGRTSAYNGTQGTSILKVFDLTVAATGLNEKTARELGLKHDKVFIWAADHAGYYPGAKNMSLKVIFEPGGGQILGSQIVGSGGVDKRGDILAVAVRAGLTARDLARLELGYAPPYSSAKDPVNMAGLVIENLLEGQVKNFHGHEVDELPRDGRVTLLDVRTPKEHAEGRIEGFVNIPLETLRGRLKELDRSRPVYVHCHSGLRSYIAARILTQKGFEAYNLSGGFRLYQSVASRKKQGH
jgi:NADPH-dependent 2,4-dienoyl-CoA reductase/sulfur reductase-like enzyme/rhodanese-related sulfurtransferase